jgi:hypothetical protein
LAPENGTWLLQSGLVNKYRSFDSPKFKIPGHNFPGMTDMLQRIHSTSLIRFISFARNRLTRAAIASLLPEIFPEIDPFDEDNLRIWNQDMIAHNAALDRGQLVSIERKHQLAKPYFISLDDYVRQMHPDKILIILEQLVKFGERVVPLVREDETARAWFLNEHLLIQAHHWKTLASRVMNLVKQLGLLAATDASNGPQTITWQDDVELVNAGRRAVEIYGVHAADNRHDINAK